MDSPKPSCKASSGREPIAIIGSGFRFPGGASNPSKLWELLERPRDVLNTIPEERFNPIAFYHPDGLHHGSSNITQSYLLEEDHRHFDSNFFSIKPVEAHSIDPQQRLLLETVYEALESAGTPIERLRGSSTGVYVGLMNEDYNDHVTRDVDNVPQYMATGTARSIISNRVSYFFDWHGPSMTIDTACSSSLVAVHQAVQTLRSGDSRVAIAAGANLILGPEPFIGESKLKMLSPDGRSKMWDVDANGYARGDGIAAVVLKPLSAALKDGDHIECLIRETGVNQDGRTKGITMPSQIAQADLIRSTYAKAGLDPENPAERCQYFEAHGTGTSAGDAVEAEAISKAFFGPESKSADPDDLLYVGSIKTIIGHTEGTAGIAGVLKASLGLQHGVLPPNMLFNRLSPRVAPFYHNLRIATEAQPWPATADGQPRRASVNSFGFGGTNAHAILESYEPEEKAASQELARLTPFTFSAVSEQSLKATLAKYVEYLRGNPSLELNDLAYTLQFRRSLLPVRAAFGASSVRALTDKIDDALEQSNSNAPVGVREAGIQSILGVFTGQGAQWAGMGRQLIQSSSAVAAQFEDLEKALESLPAGERPKWSLVEELLADGSSSKLGEAIYAQPLCTAVQVVLVDLLRAAGIKFAAVVGHSSGEIAAAYAAGYLTKDEAIKIAYYRGFFSNLAGGGARGAMMAVGTSFEDGNELCAEPDFEGRLHVAACNSPSSITLSGDADAVEQAKLVFEDERKFARLLKVDKAYHSHHMVFSSGSYTRALHSCNIKPQARAKYSDCAWYSSVQEGVVKRPSADLAGEYWRDNMVQPVLFYQALSSAWKNHGPFGLAIEVGPHPALKGPVLQSLSEIGAGTIPYTGVLSRGQDDLEAFSAALGLVWTYTSRATVDFKGLQEYVSGVTGDKLLKGLPTYSWEHDRLFWHESRVSKAYRTRKDAPHPLLGNRTASGVEEELSWRNLLRPSEVPWVRGHQLQGQMVYPAAGYVSTALEATKTLAAGQPIQLVEIRDFTIGKPLTFDSDDASVETLFTLVVKTREKEAASADFTYHALTHKDATSLTLLASGSIHVVFGDASHDLLPGSMPEPPNLVELDDDVFYSSLAAVGYGYTGPFKALTSMKRKLGYGTGLVGNLAQDNELLLHPALLDASFQAVFLAHCWPDDGSLLELHVPTKIESIRVNVPLCRQVTEGTSLPFVSNLSDLSSFAKEIRGDVDVFTPGSEFALFQIENISVVRFTEGSADTDRQLFTEHVWGPAIPTGELTTGDSATAEEYELATVLERVAIFYLQNLEASISREDRLNLESHPEAIFDFASHVLGRLRLDRQPFAKKEWLEDTHDVITEFIDRYPDNVELQLIKTVGENLPAAVQGLANILDSLLANNLLNRYYTEALGLAESIQSLVNMVSQLVHRYSHMDILEISAGTGNATRNVMEKIGKSFSTYTFTDVSMESLENAQKTFQGQDQQMLFKSLDAEKDFQEQGFEEGSYDLIVASLAFHADADLKKTLQKVRRLLKPGGYLVLLEVTSNDSIRTGFIMSGLPELWASRDDGPRFSPCLSSLQWHELLSDAGFAGIDSITPDTNTLARPWSIICSQAVDERVNLLRQPLGHLQSSLAGGLQDFVVIGGRTLRTLRLANAVSSLLKPWCRSVARINSLEDLSSSISPTSVVLSLTELDSPTFKDLDEERMQSLKDLFSEARTVLWVTQGRRADSPYSNMIVGFGRTVALELPDTRLQFLDFDVLDDSSAQILAEALVRLRAVDVWEKQGTSENLVWTTETELLLENKRLMIQRVVLNKPRIDRHNASRRHIVENKSPRASTVTLGRSGLSWAFFHSDDVPSLEPTQATSRTLQVSISSATSFFGGYYLQSQVDDRENKVTLALTKDNGSFVQLPVDAAIDIELSSSKAPSLMSWLVIELQAADILSQVPAGSKVLLHEPEPALAQRIQERAHKKGVTAHFTTSGEPGTSTPWIKLHPRVTSRVARKILPQDVSIFVNCPLHSESDPLSGSIAQALGVSCRQTTLKDILDAPTEGIPSTHLQAALENLPSEIEKIEQVQSVHLKRASELDLTKDLDEPSSLIIDWALSTAVPAIRQPIEDKISFSKNKTYVFFGLTGDLGQSLCEWTVRHGARYLVLTSRNPKLDPRWLEHMEAAGVMIKLFANDITNQAAVRAVVEKVRFSMPPIGGVANGAMVLRDTMFMEMPVESMNQVLMPKVNGSIYLDEIFRNDDLDFFIFFSSIAAVSGNRGQSNYSAANMFMTSLAAQRHKRGLAASVIHIGAIVGVGYVTREMNKANLAGLKRAGCALMSERDFHHCFAEGVLAGRPAIGSTPEVVSGLRLIQLKDNDSAPWMHNPKFSHCIIYDTASRKTDDAATDGMVPLQTRLHEARTRETALEAITDAFIVKLKNALQLSPETVAARSQLLQSGADDLGMDSLVAVEVRSWFLNEMEVDMPVLRVIGGASIGELLEFAVDKLPPNMVPSLGSTVEEQPAPAVEVTEPPLPSVDVSSVPIYDSTSSSNVSGLNTPNEDEPAAEETGVSSLSSSFLLSTKSSMVSLTEPVIEKRLPMSPGQSTFWFLRQYLEDRTAFNVTFSIEFKGPLLHKDLERAVQTVANRHESLQTCFYADEDQKPMQGIMRTSRLKLEQNNVSSKDDVMRAFEAVKEHDYDIEHGETMRVVLLSLSSTVNFLVIGYHHINMDGVSLEVFLADLEQAYKHQPFTKRPYQYSDFSMLQRREISDGSMKAEVDFWRAEFKDPAPPLPLLPFSATKSRQPLVRYEHNRVDFRVDTSLAARIKDLCRQRKVAMFHFYLAAYEVLLYRFLGTEDFCIGMADAGRSFGDVSNSMGMYLNVLPLRLLLERDQKFVDVLKAARRKAYSAMANSRLPFDLILQEVNVERSATYNPIFQALINYRQGVREKRTFGNCEGESGEYSLGKTAYDFTLDVMENPGDETLLMISVQKGLYSTEDAEVLMKSYAILLEELSKAPEANITKVPLFKSEEIDRAIELGRGPVMKPEWPETLIHRVEDVAKVHSASTALKDGSGRALSYREMLERVAAIAASLHLAGVGRGSVVAVFQEPSAELICSILATMRVGATYVPLDLRTPQARLANIVNDCNPTVTLVDDSTQPDVGGLGSASGKTINTREIVLSARNTAIPIAARADDTAVVLYTSGTTGKPKGIRLSHAGFRNGLEGFSKVYGLYKEVVLQQTAFSFDLSLEQIFVALGNGGTLVVVPQGKRGDPSAISRIVLENNVTCTMATPSEYLSWLQSSSAELSQSATWRIAYAGGEQYPLNLYHELRKLGLPNLRLLNAYGPSEATISCSKMELQADQISGLHRIPAGYTLPNCTVFIVDENLSPLPVGMPGEVCIGGAGVAKGYLARDDLTRKSFLPNKLASKHEISNGWTTFYRTGDRGVLRDDGAVVVLGRIEGDSQIKLRGIRMELKDIEESIMEAADGFLSSIVVTARGEPTFLVAHAVLSRSNSSPGAEENDSRFLKELLRRVPLPQYMLPATIIPIESLPIGAHGKVDRRAIASLSLDGYQPSNKQESFELTQRETEMLDAWKEVLPTDALQFFTIGPDADFFQVGGNSLLLIKLQAAIIDRLHTSISLVDLFKGSTLAKMAANTLSALDTEKDSFNWEAETTLPMDTLVLSGAAASRKVHRHPRCVALTGSTGFIGRTMLRELLASPQVEKVHCLAVRSPQRLSSFTQSPKLVIHRGDLNHPTLSLDEETAASLASTVDLFIHNGADVSFLKTYDSLRAPNVGSTKSLVRLAAPRKVPIHYISSAVVGRMIPFAESFAEVSVKDFAPPQDYADGYGTSKWVSEVLLEKANAELGIPVCIHRPSNVTGAEVPEDDIMHNLMSYSRQMRTVPRSERWKGVLDFVSVESVANGVLKEAMNNKGHKEMMFKHQSSEVVVPMNGLREYMEKETGGERYREVPFTEWIGLAKQHGMNGLVAAYLEEAEKGAGISTFQRLIR
ncbi:uncharacterized protein K452DRAFT_234185 [Aplosporella prunicola CBS 121167]|uniref:Carrier domain-containing protein n=1 Tax=Aplosporella prunicola CBS 121167 TaxID=1176127 RepID=A0A6A6B366_9PEZI|nr:uncharacterized protein K452DRAFT_234185 [Aplosporella prunicola CBS 121167]KAF2138629.1 hypothetical protein K452DRAFT_234185 [Aplosporella prunicola CBS 121167]